MSSPKEGMSPDAGLMLIVVRLGLVLIFTSAGAVYAYGPGYLWSPRVALIPVLLLLVLYVTARRLGAGPGVWLSDTAKRAARWTRGVVEAIVAAVHRARRRTRVRRVERAALEAAEDDGLLSPEGVRSAAEALFRLVQLAWDARDPGRLATLLGPELLAEWEQRLAEAEAGGWDPRLEVRGEVRVEYVGFTTPDGGRGPRVVVLIEAALRPYTKSYRGRRTHGEVRRLCQYWTLGLRDGVWTVLGIEEREEGRHHLTEPIGAPSRLGDDHSLASGFADKRDVAAPVR